MTRIMINAGYPTLEEKLSGPLADALRNMDSTDKQDFIKNLGNIDFSRSINKAIEVNNARDERLKSSKNIVIGVYTDGDTNKEHMVAYKPGVGSISDCKKISV